MRERLPDLAQNNERWRNSHETLEALLRARYKLLISIDYLLRCFTIVAITRTIKTMFTDAVMDTVIFHNYRSFDFFRLSIAKQGRAIDKRCFDDLQKYNIHFFKCKYFMKTL